MHDTDILIVGGGISGLATAWWLARAGREVTVLESAAQLGGKIQTDRRDGYTTEQAASLLLNFRPEVSRLVEAADLSRLKAARPESVSRNRYLIQDGRLQAVPTELRDLARTRMWSWSTRWRLLGEAFVPRGRREEETVSEFIRRRLGNEILEKAIDPFVAGTLAVDPDLANARTTLPRLTALEQRYGSITAGIIMNRLLKRRTAAVSETFSFQGGMHTLIDTLAQSPGLNVLTKRQTTELARTADGWRVTTTHDGSTETWCAREVVIATPSRTAAELIQPLDSTLGQHLASVVYAPLAVAHLAFDRDSVDHPLDGTGFLVPRREKLAFNGCLWSSTLFPARAPAGKVLMTLYVGGSRAPERYEWDNGRMVESVLDDLDPLIGLSDTPNHHWIDRHEHALPVYHGNHAARERAIRDAVARHAGLHVIGNYLGGVSIRDRVAQGYALASQIAGDRESGLEKSATPFNKRRALVVQHS